MYKDKEKYKAYQKQWREKNREKLKAYHREYEKSRRKRDKKERRFFWIYNAMRRRCEQPSYTQYKDYGGRGIKVCDRWKEFKNFKVDMFDSYEMGLTIDRVDVNGNYEPENCKWSTRQEQSENKRCNIRVTYLGETKTLLQWKKDLDIKVGYGTLRQRYYSGMKPREILKTSLYRPAKLLK